MTDATTGRRGPAVRLVGAAMAVVAWLLEQIVTRARAREEGATSTHR
jgi:hypothetical protein